jgi:hypothetical protein
VLTCKQADESLIASEKPPETVQLAEEVIDRPAEEKQLDNQSIAPAVPAQQHEETPAAAADQSTTATPFKQSVVLHVNVVSNTSGILRRVVPRFSLSPEEVPSIATLLSEVNKRYPLPTKDASATAGADSHPAVKVWLTDGLVKVVEDGEWMVALLSAGFVDWMDAEIRVLVEV